MEKQVATCKLANEKGQSFPKERPLPAGEKREETAAQPSQSDGPTPTLPAGEEREEMTMQPSGKRDRELSSEGAAEWSKR
mmetsp:Transcript_113969/g.157936  ORF Transcript_113969/g.157936 Transcript_113969/m.157936 type:complete len:80 (-) Transcript_113969:459-698(-)